MHQYKHWAYGEKAASIYNRRHLTNWQDGKEFLDWLDRLVVMGVIEPKDWDQERGKFFNIPNCCIKWYVFVGRMVINGQIGLMMSYIYGATYRGYVMCPRCRKEMKNAKL